MDEHAQMLAVVRAASSQATVHFVRGLLLGVVATVLVAALAVRLLFFHTLASLPGRPLDSPARGVSVASSLPLSLLLKLHRQTLDLSDDLESAAWLNLLLSQIIEHYKNCPETVRYLAQSIIEPALNNIVPSILGAVSVSHLSLGAHDHFPLVKRTRIRPSRGASLRRPTKSRLSTPLQTTPNESWRAEIEFEFIALSQYTTKRPQTSGSGNATGSIGRSGSIRLRKSSNTAAALASKADHSPRGSSAQKTSQSIKSDSVKQEGQTNTHTGKDLPPPPHRTQPFLSLAIDTQLVLNWPKPNVAALPIHLMIEITEFCGTLGVEFIAPTSSNTPPSITICILSGYTLNLRISSLVGSRTKLRDLPRIAELISYQLRQVITQKIVEPNFISIPLPIVPTFTDSPNSPTAATTTATTTTTATSTTTTTKADNLVKESTITAMFDKNDITPLKHSSSKEHHHNNNNTTTTHHQQRSPSKKKPPPTALKLQSSISRPVSQDGILNQSTQELGIDIGIHKSEMNVNGLPTTIHASSNYHITQSTNTSRTPPPSHQTITENHTIYQSPKASIGFTTPSWMSDDDTVLFHSSRTPFQQHFSSGDHYNSVQQSENIIRPSSSPIKPLNTLSRKSSPSSSSTSTKCGVNHTHRKSPHSSKSHIQPPPPSLSTVYSHTSSAMTGVHTNENQQRSISGTVEVYHDNVRTIADQVPPRLARSSSLPPPLKSSVDSLLFERLMNNANASRFSSVVDDRIVTSDVASTTLSPLPSPISFMPLQQKQRSYFAGGTARHLTSSTSTVRPFTARSFVNMIPPRPPTHVKMLPTQQTPDCD